MELITIEFALLVIKITISVIPLAIGMYLIFCNIEQKRQIKRAFCRALFDSDHVIPTQGFAQFLIIFGVLLIVFSCVFAWFFIVSTFSQT
jgi:hypothetical protein